MPVRYGELAEAVAGSFIFQHQIHHIMFRRHGAMVIAASIGFLISCSRPDKSKPQAALRVMPAAAVALSCDRASEMVEPRAVGGGGRPFEAALEVGQVVPEVDQAGRSWVTVGCAKLLAPTRLNQGHIYVVLRTKDGGVQGLFGGAGRNWDNFLQFSQHADGTLAFNSESEAGKVSRISLPAGQSPKFGDSFLLEIHPNGTNASLFVNGHQVGDITGDVAANYFGAGYATSAPFRGQLGEIRVFAKLSEKQQLDIRHQMLSWWGLAESEVGACDPSFAEQPAMLGGSIRGAKSGALTLVASEVPSSFIHIAASRVTAPVIDGLPAGITLLGGRSWRIVSENGQDGPNSQFGLIQKETLDGEFLGEHGFYALLYRALPRQAWRELAVTRATAEGAIHFPPVALASGEYTLGIVQGVIQKQSSARVTLAGNAIPEHLTVRPGQYLKFATTGWAVGQTLELRDSLTNAVWYHGDASKLDLGLFALRTPEMKLVAKFSKASGVLASEQVFALDLDTRQPKYYPGLLVQIQRRADGSAELPAIDQPLQPDAQWPAELMAVDYPAFRTAESIHPAPRHDPSHAQWKVPSYFHNVLPNMSLLPNAVAVKGPAGAANLARWQQEVMEWRAIHQYPLGDVAMPFLVNVRFAGGVLVSDAGDYQFRFESNFPSKFQVGEKQTTNDVDLTIHCDAGVVPLMVSMANSKDHSQLKSRMLWKPPGAVEFSVVPAAVLVHEVNDIREKAQATVVGGFAYRKAAITCGADDSAAVKSLENKNLLDQVKDSKQFDDAIRPLVDGFMKGKTLSGDVTVAMAAFDLVLARSDFLRLHPEQLAVPGFGKTDGRMMRVYEYLLPFLSLCERHPALQGRSLAARAELAQYAVATCLSRSSFAEVHHGANDGFGDEDNLILNYHRAALCMDDPYAWDAATCLYDLFFRYAPGCAESLSADGLYTFHNVNGRQIHPMGYGSSWANRILRSRLAGSPWGRTSEQNRRLGEYYLANEWIFYQGTQCWFANGRHNTHRGSSSWLDGAAKSLVENSSTTLSVDDREALQNLSKRIQKNPNNSIVGNRFFYKNLYMVHRRSDYYIDLKMISPTVGPGESFAGQVSWNMGFGDGVTTCMRDGDEFHSIHTNNGPNAAYGVVSGYYNHPAGFNQISQDGNPCLWQIRALAGTTQLDDEVYQPDRYRVGTGRVAGGVSDGELGSAGFEFALGSHGARSSKFYAFTDDGLVVLNAGITTLRKDNVPQDVTLRSNINQCDWKTSIRIVAQDGGEKVIPLDDAANDLTFPLNQRYWVEQNGVGYLIFPTGAEGGVGKPGRLRMQASTRTPLTPVPGMVYTDAQIELIKKSVKPDRAAKVFHLWIDHGQQVVDAKCAYWICMRAAKADVKAWLANPPVDVLSNESSLQAVTDLRDGVTQAFFRDAGKLLGRDGKLMMATPTPAAIMWRPEKASLTVQDPLTGCTTDGSKMTNTLKITLGQGLKGITAEQAIAIAMAGCNDPDDRYRGRPLTRQIDR